MLSVKWRPFCAGGDELIGHDVNKIFVMRKQQLAIRSIMTRFNWGIIFTYGGLDKMDTICKWYIGVHFLWRKWFSFDCNFATYCLLSPNDDVKGLVGNASRITDPNHPLPVIILWKGPVMRSFAVSLLSVRTKCRRNIRIICDLGVHLTSMND